MPSMQPYRTVIPYSCCYPYAVRGMCELKVEGRGSVMAKPDTAVVVLGVITENMQLLSAQQENAVKIAAVIRALVQTGIPTEAIQTQAYNIEPMYDYIDGRQVFRGYRVTQNLRVTIKNVNAVGKVIDAAVNAGANTVNSINFNVSDPTFYYAQALNAAIDDAIAKAAAIGMKLKINISRVPVQIIEETYQNGSPIQPFQMQTAIPATPIQPGQIEITATIKTVFIYAT